MMTRDAWEQAITFANQLPANVLVLMPLARDRQLLLEHAHELHQLIERIHDSHNQQQFVCNCELCTMYRDHIRSLCMTAPNHAT